MPANKGYRQGDIRLVPVAKLPEDLTEVPRQNGRLVLAEGEATGHLHVIDAPEATFLAADLAEIEGRFLVVEAETEHEVPVFETKIVGRYTEADLVPGSDEIQIDDPIIEMVQIGARTIKGAALTHPEHDTVVLEPGNYEVRRQREYNQAGGIRVVAD